MRHYRKIPFWENRRRLNLLGRYKYLVVLYFKNSKAGFLNNRIENDEAANARAEINHGLDEIYKIIISSDVKPSIIWTPPPNVGGNVQRIDVLHNIFNIHDYRIPPNNLLDFFERSIGIYTNDSSRAFWRTINPFYWFGQLFDFIVGLPFTLIAKAGFNRNKVEASSVGRIVKGLLYLVTVLASFLTILKLTGHLDTFNQFAKQVIGGYTPSP